MAGSFVEGERIVLETEYYGGREGPSRFTWFRQKNGGYDPIPGAGAAAGEPVRPTFYPQGPRAARTPPRWRTWGRS